MYKFSKLIISTFLIVIQFAILNAAEVCNYTVKMLCFPALDLKMKLNNYDKDNKKLEFFAQTNNTFDKLYKVENYYQCIYDKQSFRPEFRSKKIDQPGFEQVAEAEYENGKAHYSNGKKLDIPRQTYSLLSLLMYLRFQDLDCNNSDNIKIEVEGTIYAVDLQKTGVDKIEVDNKKIKADVVKIVLTEEISHQKIFEDSDIFFNNVVNPKGKRKVWIEKGGQKRILKAKFSLKGVSLVARLKGG